VAGRARRGARGTRQLSAAGDVDAATLERLAVGAWLPDEVADQRGWLLRAADGFTGRGNSALVLAEPRGTTGADDLDDRLADVAQWYAMRGLPAMLAVPVPRFGHVAARARVQGWTRGHGGRVLVADLHRVRHGTAPTATTTPYRIAVTADVDPAWLGQYHPRGASLPDAGRRMLTRGDRVGFAAARTRDGDVVAIGRGVVVDGWLGLNAFETATTHRRRGLAMRILGALVTWARGHGATRAFLQVDLSDDVAHEVWRRTGFGDHHAYRYLRGPNPQRRPGRGERRTSAARGQSQPARSATATTVSGRSRTSSSPGTALRSV
jgi:GNAT superfamily N-acetyltransferase